MPAISSIHSLVFKVGLALAAFLWASAGAKGQSAKIVLHEPFTQPPGASVVAWAGDLSHFHLAGNPGQIKLMGNTARSDTSWLAAPLSLMHGEWEYLVEFGSEPSQTNRADLVLMSSLADLKSAFDGYIVKAGDNGSADVLRLMRVDRGALIPMLNGTLPIGGGGKIWVRVQRTAIGRWSMQSSSDGTAWTDEGSAVDTTYSALSHTGFRFIYTRTRAQDYALGPITIRRNPPAVVSSRYSDGRVRIRLDTPMDPRHSPEFYVDGIQILTAGMWTDPWHYETQAPHEFDDGVTTVELRGLRTADGMFENVIATGALLVERPASPGDVLINEYLYYPPEGVPQFVELINVSTRSINLRNWELRDFSAGNRRISDTDLWLRPDSLLVLTPDPDGITAYYGFARSMAMARFPFLNRGSRDGIILRSAEGKTIDSLAYQPSSQGDGVSIERASPATPSEVPENWQPSKAFRGATPGAANTASPPVTIPGILRHELEGRKRLKIKFRTSIRLPSHENVRSANPIERLAMPSPDSLIVYHTAPLEYGGSLQWRLTGMKDAFGRPIPDTLITATLQIHPPFLGAAVAMRPDSLVLHFSEPVMRLLAAGLALDGRPLSIAGTYPASPTAAKSHAFRLSTPLADSDLTRFKLAVAGFVDRDGLTIPDTLIAISKPAGDGLMLSEVMFNPLQQRYDARGDQAQYVEIYNGSPYSQWLHGLRLLGTPSPDGRRPTLAFEIPQTAAVPPEGRFVLTADTARVSRSRLVRYFQIADTTHVFRTNRSTLGFSSQSGQVALSDMHGDIVDSMSYAAEMHQLSVRDRRGVSLERVRFDLPGNDRRNWSSHAGVWGGSPLLENSVSSKIYEQEDANILSVSPIPFSPDNDGRDDILTIRVVLDRPGWLVTLTLFDRHGRRVRTLADGERAAVPYHLLWNGLDDRGNPLPTGIYVALLEAWHMETAQRRVAKAAIALLHQPIRASPFK